jgi:hypothetical protein
MRKFIAIFFLLVYANVGLATAIDFHFCGGHLSNISFAKINPHSSCCCKTKSMANDCCKDETALVKADNHQCQDIQQMPESGFKILAAPSLPALNESLYNPQIEQTIFSPLSRLRSSGATDIFLTIRNLRI